MLTLYHAPRSRSTRFLWLLEEIGAPYSVVRVEIRRPDGSGAPDPRNPHPDGKVPALVHDDALVTESTAIALYLSDAFPGARVGPAVGDPLRGPYLTWLAWYAAELEPAVVAKAVGRTEQDATQARAYDAVVARLRGVLEQGPHLLGESFSAADVLVTSVFQWGRHLLPAGAPFDDYVARTSARPALRKAMAKDDA